MTAKETDFKTHGWPKCCAHALAMWLDHNPEAEVTPGHTVSCQFCMSKMTLKGESWIRSAGAE